MLTDDREMECYKLLPFQIPCDCNGTPIGNHSMELNSKNGMNYNHRKIWETYVQRDSSYRPYNKRPYNYYPRGRVQIANNKARIYLNQNINTETLIAEIKSAFGLSPDTISHIRIMVDNSVHYECWMD